MNCHLLSHLVLYTKAWGPMWTMSCFPFESMNHVLKKHFHGTREVATQVILMTLQFEVPLETFDFQIAQNFSRLQLLPRLVNYYYNNHDDGFKRYVPH